MEFSRREFLAGLTAATGVGALAPAEDALARRSRTIEAITNPIFLAQGPEPAGNEPVEAPPNP